MMRRGRVVPASAGAVRGISAVMAVLYLGTAAFLVYFRLVTVQKVMDRLHRDGAEIPGWFPVVFTVGPVIVLLYLLIQGGRHLRRALGKPGPAPGAP